MGNSFRSIKLNDNIFTIDGINYPLDAVSTPTVSTSNSSFVGIGCTDNGNGTCTLVVNGQEITVNGEEYAPTPVAGPYLTFSSPDTFTLNVVDNQKYWDGTLQYSTDTTTWNTWNGTTTLSSSSSGTTKYLYLRGIANTYITGSSANNTKGKWVLTGSSIECNGNIETLLDYATVVNGQHPPMANYCYSDMFNGCTSLTTAPSLPATTLTTCCYTSMFSDCTALTTAPALPATTLATSCYYFMFSNCSALTTPAIIGGGTTQVTAAKYCCYSMHNYCTSLNLYTTSTNHTPFYKAMTYSTVSSSADYRSTYRMFYYCQIDGATYTSSSGYIDAGTQLYY